LIFANNSRFTESGTKARPFGVISFTYEHTKTVLLLNGQPIHIQGCQIFHFTIFQSGKNIPIDYKITKCPLNIPYCRKVFPMTKHITTFSIPRSSKIYPNWYFWSEKKPSGNPVHIAEGTLFTLLKEYCHLAIFL
jgi:hypothetical protein